MTNQSTTYLNPVYTRSCPDPFVLKWAGEYWAYCTGHWHDERAFGILHSPDLVDWQEIGGALEPLPGDFSMYWAPEVSYHNGRFYMYYSVGNETLMEIRVATADHPAGPFVDSGHRLTAEAFAIDPHVFEDDDGARYLFYATDFLEHTHIGTGTVCARLLDPYTLAAAIQPVTRARYDWQVYDPQRAEKGGVRWHTIEGSFVLKHKGRYYQMFSGGNWQNISYGVSYALTENISAPEEWRQVADGETVLPVLRTIPGAVIGPGHNSVVRGPDNQQLFCIYHRWANDNTGRVLAIDRLDWVGERMIVLGPSVTPQPRPILPSAQGFSSGWRWHAGQWSHDNDAVVQESLHPEASASYAFEQPYFVVELSLRVVSDLTHHGTLGIALSGLAEPVLAMTLAPATQHARITWQTRAGWHEQMIPLPADFYPLAYHLLRVEVNALTVSIMLDASSWRWHGTVAAPPTGVSLHTSALTAAFTGFAATLGWRDLFTQAGVHPAELGWQMEHPQATLAISDQHLWCRNATSTPAVARKDWSFTAAEIVVNIRLVKQTTPEGGYGFGFFANNAAPRILNLGLIEDGWAWSWPDDQHPTTLLLPPAFNPLIDQQFRLRTSADHVTIWWEAAELGTMSLPAQPTTFGIVVRQAEIACDEVRATALELDGAADG